MVFCSYLTGEERNLVIEEKANELEYQKLSMLYDITRMQHEIYEKEVELKILKESASYDDYTYFLEEGEVQNQQQQQGIFQRIVQWFKNLFAKIKAFITGSAKTIDDNAEAEIDEEDVNEQKISAIGKIVDAGQQVINKLNPQNPDGSVNVAQAAIEIAGAATVLGVTGGAITYAATGKKKRIKGTEAKQKINMFSGILDKLNQFIDFLSNKFGQIIPPNVKTFLDTTIKGASEFINSCINNIKNAFGVVADAAGNVVNKVTGNNKPESSGESNDKFVFPKEGDEKSRKIWDSIVNNAKMDIIPGPNGYTLYFKKGNPNANPPQGCILKAAKDSSGNPVQVSKDDMYKFASTNKGKALKEYIAANGSPREVKKINNVKNAKNKKANDESNAKKTNIYRYKDGNGVYQYFKDQGKTQPMDASQATTQVNQGSAVFVDVESANDIDIYDIVITENDGVIEFGYVYNESVEDNEVVLNEELSQFESIFGTVLEEENDTDPEVKELQDMFAEL